MQRRLKGSGSQVRVAVRGFAAAAALAAVAASGATAGISQSRPIVVDSGSAAGEPYEWVAYGAWMDSPTPPRRSKRRGSHSQWMFCIGLDWPQIAGRETYRGCGGKRSQAELRAPHNGFDSYGYEVLPSERPTGDRDIAVYGTTREDVTGMTMKFTDADGNVHDIEVDFKRVDGKLLKRSRGYHPFGTFVAVIPGELAPTPAEIDLIGPEHPRSGEEASEDPEHCHTQPERGPIDFVLTRDGRETVVHTLRGRYARRSAR